jgi:prepilin-type N-terminal cleavage/methylation domain-containing protein
MTSRGSNDQAGFTLLELLIAMGVMLVVLAGTTQVMTDAVKGSSNARQMLDMNAQLRATMDLIQRDLLQVGQGLPTGRRIGIPNGSGAQAIRRPGPDASGACPGVSPFPADDSLPAVHVGPGLGPEVNGQCTDVVTVLAADNVLEPLNLVAISSNGSTATIRDDVDLSDDPDAQSDNIRAGDLVMIERGIEGVLLQVTSVSGNTLAFDQGTAVDPLGLNQRDTGLVMLGTINQLKAASPVVPNAPVVVSGVQQSYGLVTRIRMNTYFVDTTIDPEVPRLMRAVGGREPTAVAIAVDAFRLTYDIADQVNNPTDVRMDNADLTGGGACSPDPCTENQIRKVNVLLSMRASGNRPGALNTGGRQSQSTLYTQVSLRSMAFVDRYR